MLIGELPVCEPFPWPHLLQYLRLRATPQFDVVAADRYMRKVGRRVVEVTYDASSRCLRVAADGRIVRQTTLERIGRLFGATYDPREVHERLHGCAVLGSRLEAVPGLRPLGAWDPFELCIRTILGQQVSVAAAGTLLRRLLERCGEIVPARVASADLANIGMPGKRVGALQTFARACEHGAVDFANAWPALERQLSALPGFGPWTRTYLAIRLGREPDAFPQTDLGLIRAAQVDSPAALLELARRWQPYRAYAATYLWAVEPV